MVELNKVNLLIVLCVTVPTDHFENIKDVLINGTTAFHCRYSPGANVVWYYQQYCDNFEHGLYSCSSQTAITAGNQYQIRTDSPGEHSLLISSVTKSMTGLYTCENRQSRAMISSMFLNVVCKYNFLLLLLVIYRRVSS